MKFPLPMGHVYGVNPYSIQHHRGDTITEVLALKAFQARAALVLDADLKVTGQYDGPTQRVVADIQRSNALLVTAELNQPTWDALWSTERAQNPVPIVPATPEPLRLFERPRRGRPPKVRYTRT